MAVTYTPITTQTLTTSTASVTLSSISSAYTDLILVASFYVTTAAYGITYQFNGDTATNYSATAISGNGTSATSSRATTTAYALGSAIVGGVTSGEPFTNIIHLMNYSNSTTYKTSLVRSNMTTGSYPGTEALVNLWRSTAAITSIVLKAGNGASNFAAGSTFTLYGIKAA